MLEGGVDVVLFVDVVVVRVGGADSDAADVGELFQGSGFDDGAVSDDAGLRRGCGWTVGLLRLRCGVLE